MPLPLLAVAAAKSLASTAADEMKKNPNAMADMAKKATEAAGKLATPENMTSLADKAQGAIKNIGSDSGGGDSGSGGGGGEDGSKRNWTDNQGDGGGSGSGGGDGARGGAQIVNLTVGSTVPASQLPDDLIKKIEKVIEKVDKFTVDLNDIKTISQTGLDKLTEETKKLTDDMTKLQKEIDSNKKSINSNAATARDNARVNEQNAAAAAVTAAPPNYFGKLEIANKKYQNYHILFILWIIMVVGSLIFILYTITR